MSESSAQAHQFDSLEQQHEASSLGMWVFLLTEIMFFGGMFTGYVVYRNFYPEAFRAGSGHLDVVLGTVNTALLLVSSLSVALAVRAAETGHRKRVIVFLIVTLLLGSAFVGIKGFEYHHKFEENMVPGTAAFAFEEADERHAEIFFSFYFAMTGMHALHMLIGIVILAFLAFETWRGRYSRHYYFPIEMTGLYWHFVDIVWVFLFPLLYLIDRSS